MALDYSKLALPKPTPRKRVKARKDREDAKRLAVFRDAVWRRERVGHEIYGWGKCQLCGVIVTRELRMQTGEVHHRIGRGAKATRYNPDNGVLLCNAILNDCHGKVQRHEVPCP